MNRRHFDVPCDLLLPERPAQGTKERLLSFKYKETEALQYIITCFRFDGC